MIPLPSVLHVVPWRIILLLCFINGFGLLVLYSAADGNIEPWALNQAIRFVVFLGLALAIGYIPLARIEQTCYLGYAAVLILLIMVALLGNVRGGSQRWISLGFVNLQPSELMKVALVLACARFYARLVPGLLHNVSSVLSPLVIFVAVPVLLVMLQPDLGTTLALLVGAVAVLFVAGLPMWWFVASGAVCLAMLPIAYTFLHEYQQRRILTFFNPAVDPLGAGYHVSQSKIAIGSGGWFGKGFLNGSQSQLDYLPEGHTDFIFATMVEEWGIVGGFALMSAFFLLLRWALNVALQARTHFGRMVAGGLMVTMFFYIAVNLLMVMGLAPVVGIPLPLFSYGGSSMLTFMICIGILWSIERDSRSVSAGFGERD